MTISKSLHRLSITTRIFGTLVAGTVLLAGMNAAHGKGGGGGGGNHSSGNFGNSNHSNSGSFLSGKSNRANIERPIGTPTRTLPVLSKGNGNSMKGGSNKESRRELRKEYKKELRKEIAQLKRLERCKVFGKCGGIGKLPPQPVKIGKPIPSPVPVGTGTGGTGGTTTAGGPGTTPPTKPPVLSDPGYGKPAPTSGGSGGGGGKTIDDPSPGTTIKPF